MDDAAVLAADGDLDAPHPLVLLHGFTQDRRSWAPVRRLSARPTIAVDAPGHGGSGALDATLPEAAGALARTVGRAATYVGYSMGGRLALHLAVAVPAAVERLVLVSTTAGLDDDAERAARRRADEALAARIEAIGVAAFVDEWLALAMFSGLPADPDERAARLANTAAGLAASLRSAGTGAQESLWDATSQLPMSVLVVAGADDHKFVAIARRLAATIPRASLELVAGAGHSVHLERPGAFVELLERWLVATDPAVERLAGGEH